MAMTSLGHTTIQTDRSTSTAGAASAAYDPILDALTLWLIEHPVPHLTESANAFVSVLFDLTTGAAIGVRIDNFLAFAVHEFPRLQVVAQYLDLVPRQFGDTELLNTRVIMESNPYDDDMARETKKILENIIDETGGFDSDAFLEAMKQP
jgi:Fe-S-cluster formation regulator IscX/YfhJ